MNTSIINIKLFHGKEISNWIDPLAKLRISEFKEFPYLYVGDIESEKIYITRYAEDDRSIFVLAFCNNEIIGIVTGAPLLSIAELTPNIPEAFKKNGLNPNDYYYCGEFIVKSKYRNQGIAKRLFVEQLVHIKKYGYKNLCLMTVNREENDPLKPKNYISTDALWEKFGFIKTNITTQLKWPTILPDKQIANTNHALSFWIKESI